MKSAIRLAAVLIACFLLVVTAFAPRLASAHPMGRASVNHYSALSVGEERVTVLYVIDMAEQPALQELGTIRSDHSTALTPPERNAYLAKKGPDLVKGLTLTLDGKPLTLKIERSDVSFSPGDAGSPTLRLELNLSASLGGAQEGTLDYRDDNFPQDSGWKEIVASLDVTASLQQSVPEVSVSNALRQYKSDLINHPPNVVSARIWFSRDSTVSSTTTQGSQGLQPSDTGFGSAGWIMQQTNVITDLMNQRELPLGALLAAMAVAFMVGAAHALSPGHGKTVVAAYLVGSRGTPAHAVVLGLTVTLSHTIGVFLIGFIVLYAAQFILPETLYPWLTLGSGLLLALMGVSLFFQRRRTWKKAKLLAHTQEAADVMAGEIASPRIAPDHNHDHDGEETGSHDHDHNHDFRSHDHDHGHTLTYAHTYTSEQPHVHDDATTAHKHWRFGKAHSHLPADGQAVTLGNLLALGITGGILPCPSALVVLLVAIGSGRVGLGMLLILAFSSGLAAVLMGIGLIMVYSRNMLNRASARRALLRNGFVRRAAGFLPMFSALVVSVLGVFIALGAFSR